MGENYTFKKIMEEPIDAYILSFKDNKNYCIDIFNSETKPTQWLHDLSKGTAKYIGKDKYNRIEISIPVTVFIELKENQLFQSKCFNLERVRNTKRSILGYLTTPLKSIDNDLNNQGFFIKDKQLTTKAIEQICEESLLNIQPNNKF